MRKILYFYPSDTSFIRTDRELLSRNFSVGSFLFDGRKKILTPWQFILQFFFLLANSRKAKAFMCNFAGYHSFLPALFGKWFHKPCILILAGTDCVSFPSINYGNFNRKLLGRFTKWSLELCTHTCPVHASLVISDYTYTNDDYPRQGYLYFCKSAQKKFTEIPYGYDQHKFFLTGDTRTPNSFLTVTQSIRKQVYFRKGIDMMIEIAKRFPGYSFTIIGKDTDKIETAIPSNLQLLAPVKFEELVYHYNRHEFYLQLSICEGFPNALCEAMLCGCIPIGSRVAAIPEIISDTGFILEHKNLNELEALIRKANTSNRHILSNLAHKRIRENFTLERRAAALKSVIDAEMS